MLSKTVEQIRPGQAVATFCAGETSAVGDLLCFVQVWLVTLYLFQCVFTDREKLTNRALLSFAIMLCSDD